MKIVCVKIEYTLLQGINNFSKRVLIFRGEEDDLYKHLKEMIHEDLVYEIIDDVNVEIQDV